MDEKAELPAIIVTPSSPSGEHDFHIAFLAPTPKPTLKERVSAALPKLPKVRLFHRRLPSEIQLPTSPYKNEFDTSLSYSVKARARTAVLLAILVFIMGCHLIMHSMLSSHPRLDFSTSDAEDVAMTMLGNGSLDDFGNVPSNPDSATPSLGGWFNLHAMWAPMHTTSGRRGMRFVVTDVASEVSPDDIDE